MSDVKWIKITTNIFDDEKMKLIDSMPARDELIVIWFKLLTLAGKCNSEGMLFLNSKIAYTNEMLATIFNRELNSVTFALNIFESFGMIHKEDAEVITISNWDKHQNVDGLDKIRAQTKQRVERHRQQQKALESKKQDFSEVSGEPTQPSLACNADETESVTPCNVTCNVTVTQCNATEEERELEKEKEKNKKNTKEKNKKGKEALIDSPATRLDYALIDFINHRKTIRAPVTEHSLKLLIGRLNELSDSEDEQVRMLNHAIMSGWKTVYPVKDSNANKPKQDAFTAQIERMRDW